MPKRHRFLIAILTLFAFLVPSVSAAQSASHKTIYKSKKIKRYKAPKIKRYKAPKIDRKSNKVH